MSKLHFVFVTTSHDLYQHWKATFAQLSSKVALNLNLTFHHGSVEELFENDPVNNPHRTAIVCPANLLLFMGGGFDLGVLTSLTEPMTTYKFLEGYVKSQCKRRFHGFVPRSTVETIELERVRNHRRAYSHWNVNALLLVPLMIVPESIPPNQARQLLIDCMWNVIVHCTDRWDTVVMPGIGGGYGNIDDQLIAHMQLALLYIYELDVLPTTRGLYMLFLLGKDYRKFGGDDAEMLGQLVTDYGHRCIGKPQDLLLVLECVRQDDSII